MLWWYPRHSLTHSPCSPSADTKLTCSAAAAATTLSLCLLCISIHPIYYRHHVNLCALTMMIFLDIPLQAPLGGWDGRTQSDVRALNSNSNSQHHHQTKWPVMFVELLLPSTTSTIDEAEAKDMRTRAVKFIQPAVLPPGTTWQHLSPLSCSCSRILFRVAT